MGCRIGQCHLSLSGLGLGVGVEKGLLPQHGRRRLQPPRLVVVKARKLAGVLMGSSKIVYLVRGGVVVGFAGHDGVRILCTGPSQWARCQYHLGR